MIIKLSVGIIYLSAIANVISRNKIFLFYSYSLSILIFSLNYFFFHLNRPELLKIVIPFFLGCLPSLIYSFSIEDKKVFENITFIGSSIIYVVGIFMGILLFSGTITMGGYSMPYSYYMLLPTLVFLKYLLDSFSVKYCILTLVSLIMIVAFGSRGPILSIAVFVILYQIINLKVISLKHIFRIILIIIFLSVLLIYLKEILLILNSIVKTFGIRSRTIILLLQEETTLSGRDNIAIMTMREIAKSPLLGIGIAGDRSILGTYPHNIALEIIADFGIIAGFLIISFILFISFNVLFRINQKDSNFLLVWFCVGFVPFFLSHSYLTHIQFWIYMGLSSKYYLIYRKKKV
ncbi:MAG: O-antigen ligase family protein [Candidatus Delongbacteria bacterium]|nr:O-antigen ligase family protein [Candidatus Delongbacteria bacterium]